MAITDTGKQKVQQICDQLRKETLDPAKEEAKSIVADAKAEAGRIIEEAKKQAEKQFQEAKARIEKEKEVAQSSMLLSGKQALSSLRSQIEGELFAQDLNEKIEKHMSNDAVVANAINAVIESIQKDGLSSNLEVAVGKSVSREALLAKIASDVKEKLSESPFHAGGAVVKLVDKRMSIDLSDDALKQLLSSFLADSMHKFIFEA
ncbi:MAG: V-type ATP synthase subunit E [Simkaniaceae bacterium]|nr:V-type ATP synthase subunit E [Simkaniaceae bacterium]